MIDLRNAKPGDKLRDRNGDISTYVGRNDCDYYPHRVMQGDHSPIHTRTDDGKILGLKRDRGDDIVEIITEKKNMFETTKTTKLTVVEDRSTFLEISKCGNRVSVTTSSAEPKKWEGYVVIDLSLSEAAELGRALVKYCEERELYEA